MKKVIVIAGMTGVGKSNIAKILANHINGEIVTADSLQIYKGLNILTNKPNLLQTQSNLNQNVKPQLQQQQQRSLASTQFYSEFISQQMKQVPQHCLATYDPLNPITSSQYANEVRHLIKDILKRNKTPIIEGGSPFYISQIFNPALTNFNDEQFFEAKELAADIIQLDGNNFEKSYKRMVEVCQKVEIPQSDLKKVGPNDFYRLEMKLAFALFLQISGESYETFNKKAEDLEENKYFKNLDKRCFYLFGNKHSINEVIDLRVEDMLQNDQFFPEVIEFGKDLIKDNNYYKLKINALYKSIGFLETMNYLNEFHQYSQHREKDKQRPQLYFDHASRKDVKVIYKKIVTKYLDEFKAKSRQYAKKQNIWYRKEKDFLWIDVIAESNFKNVLNKMINAISKQNLSSELSDPLQEQMKMVNTKNEELRQYRSQSRILSEPYLYNKFLNSSLKVASENYDVVSHSFFDSNTIDFPKYQSKEEVQTMQSNYQSEKNDLKNKVKQKQSFMSASFM